MGCSDSKQAPLDMTAIYTQKGLPLPDSSIYENEFEKETFMAINLIRVDPKLLIPQIKEIKKHKNFKGQAVLPLIKFLESMDPVTPILFDENACKACRSNSEKKMGANFDTGLENFERGGNGTEYSGMLGSGEKSCLTEECTTVGWKGTASELVYFNLVEGFERDKNHPMIDEKTVKVGVSFKSHKKYENVF
jgi:hypothetical protein